MKRWLIGLIWVAAALLCELADAQYVTLSGTLQASNGLPAPNYVISFTPSQFGFIAGTGVVVNATTYCGTGVDGGVVGVTNPLQPTINTPSYSGGTLPAANYYVEFAWHTTGLLLTQVSPESTAQLTSTGNLIVAPPAGGAPAGVDRFEVYIGTSSGTETLQGSVAVPSVYVQNSALISGTIPPVRNTTVCQQVANDAIWPVGTGYTVSLTDPSGNTLPGYPMMWNLNGPNSTIDLSNGLPYYNGIVTFPAPILASPYNHSQQSISGPLSLGSYFMTAGGYGVGVMSPLYGLDAEGSGNYGLVNAKGGYVVNGAGGTSGQGLCSDGTYLDAFCSFALSSSLFYQTVASNGANQTQRPTLNFSPSFAVSDSASPARTTVDLATTAVTPGSYNCTNTTVDAYGRLTAASSGTCSPSFTGGSGYQTLPSGLILEWGNTGSIANDTPTAITLPHAFPTACLNVTATDSFLGGFSAIWSAYSCTTTQFTARPDMATGGANWLAIGY